MSDSRRVLFVEDDEAARLAYTDYLSANGCNVIPVANGEDALTVASAMVPHIVVLDLGLPDIDGWEVARRLKASSATAHVPIIALTGADLPHERVSAMRAGCDWHLVKPCTPSFLLDTIHHALRAQPTP